MPKLSFSVGFHSSDLQGVDLPIEIRKENASLLKRAVSSEEVELPAGNYFVYAQMPAGQPLSAQVNLQHDGQQAVLSPEPGDESPHESDEIPHFFGAKSSIPALADDDATEFEKTEFDAGPSFVAAGAGAPGEPGVSLGASYEAPPKAASAPELRIFGSNPFAGAPAPASTPTVAPRQLGPAAERVELRAAAGAPFLAQLLMSPGNAVNLVVPCGPSPSDTPTLVAVTRERSESGRLAYRLEAHLANRTADLLIRYSAEGAYLRASHLSTSKKLLMDKMDDPIAATAGAYVLLRTNAFDVLDVAAPRLDQQFQWSADGAAIHGEYLARRSRHEEAAEAFLRIGSRGLPAFSDGLFYVVERLRGYVNEGDSVGDVGRIRALLEQLGPFARAASPRLPFVCYPGTDPFQPGSRTPSQAAPLTAPLELSSLFTSPAGADGFAAPLAGANG